MNLSASPIDIKIDDATYQLSPMTEGDVGTMNLYIRDKFMQMAMKYVPADGKMDYFKATLQEAKLLDMFSEEGVKFISDTEGFSKCLHICLKKNHATITIQEVEKLVSDNFNTWMEAFNKVNDFIEAALEQEGINTNSPLPVS